MRYPAALILLFALLSAAAVARAQDESPQTQLPPMVAPGVFQRGIQAINEEDYEQAVVDFSLSILLNPTLGQAYYGRAISYDALGDTESALSDLAQAIQYTVSMPDFQANVYATRADMYMADGRTEEAIADYGEAIDIFPTTEIYARRALLYISQANFDAAVSDLDEAIDLTGDLPVLYYYRAIAKSGLQEDEDAADDFLQWVTGIGAQTAEEDLLEPGQSITLNMEQSLVHTIPLKGREGQVINLIAANLSGDADPLMVLVSPAGVALAGNDDFRGGDTSAVIANFEIPQEGFYTLLVTHSIVGFNGRVIVMMEEAQ